MRRTAWCRLGEDAYISRDVDELFDEQLYDEKRYPTELSRVPIILGCCSASWGDKVQVR